MTIKKFSIPKIKEEEVNCPTLGGKVRVTTMTVGDAMRQQELIGGKEETTITEMISVSLMCSMKTSDGSYLIPENDRLAEVCTLDNKTATMLYAAYLRLNPIEAGTLEDKKK